MTNLLWRWKTPPRPYRVKQIASQNYKTLLVETKFYIDTKATLVERIIHSFLGLISQCDDYVKNIIFFRIFHQLPILKWLSAHFSV